MKKNKLLIIKILIWSLSALFFGTLIYLNYYPRATHTINCSAKYCSRLIKTIHPSYNKQDGYLEFNQGPIYLELNALRHYKNMDVTLEYADSSTDLIMRVPINNNELKTEVVNSQTINNLSVKKWTKIVDGNINLYQRKNISRQYSSVAEFLSAPPTLEEVSEFNFKLAGYARLPSYQPNTTETVINQKIKGSYSFYTYIEKEKFSLQFLFDEQNLTNSDEVNIVIIRNPDKTVYQNSINLSDPNFQGSVEINLPDAPDGLYIVAVETSNDIITEQIISNQKLIVFKPSIFLADNNNTPVTLYTNGNYVNFYSDTIKGLQTVAVNNESLKIAKSKKDYRKEIPFSGQLQTITIPNGNVSIATDGWLVFAPEQFFWASDLLWEIPQLINLENFNDINYIITSYQPSAGNQAINEKKINFAPLSFPADSNIIRLDFLTPQTIDPPLRIKKIKIKFYN